MLAGPLLGLLTLSGQPCPPVEVVRTPVDPGTAVHLAFLPEGFVLDDLPRYRCAVDEIGERLLAEPPFSTWADRIGFERMDLVSADGRVETDACTKSCPGDCAVGAPCSYGDEYWGDVCSGDTLTTISASEAAAIPVRDFDVRVCGGRPYGETVGERCEWLAVGNLDGITDLVSCFSAPTLVVVVAKRFLVSGGAGYEQEPPLAVVTVEGLQTEAASRRLAHELGHGLGLLDEYGGTSAVDLFDATATPECGRNVVVLGSCCSEGVPWAERCETVSGFDNECPESLQGCEAPTPAWTLGSCEIVRDLSSCGSSEPCAKFFDPPDEETYALVEGAHYRDCDAYRSAYACRMRHHMNGFCPFCGDWLEDSLESLIPPPPDEVVNLRRADTRTDVGPSEAPPPPGGTWEASGGPWADDSATPSWEKLVGARIVSIDAIVITPGFRARVPLQELRAEFPDTDAGPASVRVRAKGRLIREAVAVEGVPPAPTKTGGKWLFRPYAVRATAEDFRRLEPDWIRIRYVPARGP